MPASFRQRSESRPARLIAAYAGAFGRARRLGAAAATCAGAALAALASWPGIAAAAAAAPAPMVPMVQWSVLHPAASPPPLGYAAAAFDADQGDLVVFGGVEASGALSDSTWIWDGRTWSEASGSAPPAREMASMAFDPALHQLILFGGRGAGGQLLGDTWAWNGLSWYEIAASLPDGPAPREQASLAYDAAGDLVLFGGTGYAPSASAGSPGPSTTSASQDGATKVLGDTWIWNGQKWALSDAPGPPARSGAAFTWDSTDHQTVLFSGETSPSGANPATLVSDTWTWNGTTWSQRRPSASPPPRTGAVFTDAPGASGALLCYGEGVSGALGDTWVWTHGDWVQAKVSSAEPPARVGAAWGFDPRLPGATVFGGIGAGGVVFADTDLATVSLPEPSATTTTTTAPSASTTTQTARSTTTTVAPTTAPHGHSTVTTTTVAPRSTRSAGPLSLRASADDVRPGTTVHLSGEGFAPGSLVVVSFHSKPAVMAKVRADSTGGFSAAVTVPPRASPGHHSFVAAGVTPEGRPVQLVAAVYVLPPLKRGLNTVEEGSLVALALVIPGGAWVAMTALGRWRSRRTPPG
ncbi:MAG TPA: hypothetical protein VKU88_00470 [Acidimicrobiales bacterium]|nr:hypothetical protein [Acidimicrobiales bacterium]